MKINVIGIGKMGYPLVQNMLEHNHNVNVFDVNKNSIEKITKELNVEGTTDFSAFMDTALKENNHRIFWIMLPPGDITNLTILKLVNMVHENDIVIDGGNSNHQDSIKNSHLLEERKAFFMDVGTSGGVSGARNGASFMIGGNKQIYDDIEPLFASLSAHNGYIYTGKSGSGHFLKLVHNAIYYGIQQAYGEGLEILEKSEFDYNLGEVTRALNNSSVIRSWILEILADSLSNDKHLDNFNGHIKGSKSTSWVITEAMSLDVPVPVIYSALAMRQRGLQDAESFSGKVVSAIRSGVGGYSPKN